MEQREQHLPVNDLLTPCRQRQRTLPPLLQRRTQIIAQTAAQQRQFIQGGENRKIQRLIKVGGRQPEITVTIAVKPGVVISDIDRQFYTLLCQ